MPFPRFDSVKDSSQPLDLFPCFSFVLSVPSQVLFKLWLTELWSCDLQWYGHRYFDFHSFLSRPILDPNQHDTFTQPAVESNLYFWDRKRSVTLTDSKKKNLSIESKFAHKLSSSVLRHRTNKIGMKSRIPFRFWFFRCFNSIIWWFLIFSFPILRSELELEMFIRRSEWKDTYLGRWTCEPLLCWEMC